MDIRLKRVYEPPAAEDGLRVLVDRLWPRGLSREQARVDRWLKEVAPSTGLRKWFGHDPARWTEFRRRYSSELKEHREVLRDLLGEAPGTVTLLFAAHDEEHNNAVILRSYLRRLKIR